MDIWENRHWEPMMLGEVNKPFNSNDYIYELKFDGYRALIFASPKSVSIQSRNGLNLTFLYPELQKIKKMVKQEVIFDGEITAFVNDKPSFAKLQERSHLKNKNKIIASSEHEPVIFICFDCLYFNGKNICEEILMKRKEILNKFEDNDVFVKSPYLEKEGIKLFKIVKKNNLEGIIAKKKDSLYYRNERTNEWLKIKNLQEGIFYIGGFLVNKNNTLTLLLGEYQNHNFIYVGKVIMPKKNKMEAKIKKAILLNKSPFINYQEKANYLSPQYKCQIKYLEKTSHNHLREAIFSKEIE